MHCEAYLASLLENYTKSGGMVGDYVSEKLVKELQVKQSLFLLLNLIKYMYRVMVVLLEYPSDVAQLAFTSSTSSLPIPQMPHEDHYLVHGRHPKLSGCTLPPWTAPGIVKDMNITFGAQLRKDLIQLLSADDRSFGRPRSLSQASQSLSVDSNEGPSEGLEFFTAPAMRNRY